MVSPFEMVILRLKELGFFTFLLPFILVAAILYGLLRKSQIFGPPERNVAVNAVVAIVASLMVWASPVIAGINIEQELARFFTQITITTLVLMMMLLAVGMLFPKDLSKEIGEKLGAKYLGVILVAGVIIGVAILITSGLMNVFFPAGVFEGIPEDMVIGIATIVGLFAVVGAVVWLTGREEKKP
jgi:hypothetical protein